MSSLVTLHCDYLTDVYGEPVSFTVAYVDPDIAGKIVGETNTQLFSWDWPANDQSKLQIVTSIIDMTSLSIVNTAITSVPDQSGNSRELWGCRVEPTGDWGLNNRNVTPMLANTAAAR
jgi:hypothetical protein